MTEIDLYKPPAAEVAVPPARDTDSWIAIASDVIKVANVIADTPFVPDGLRGSSPAVAAAILAGRELGLGPMTSLANIHVIKGKPALAAVLMRALIQSQGHQWEDVEATDTRVVIRARRRGEPEWTTVSFTADQARQAKIDLGGYPQDKLYARATSRLARRKFADVIAGMPHSAEELEDEDAGEAPAAIAAPAAAPKTARRQMKTQDQDGARGPVASQPGIAVAAAAGTDQPATAGNDPSGSRPGPDLPPLPGEEDDRRETLASSGQVGIIAQHFKRLGFEDTERDSRLAATSVIAGRMEGITSTKQLTQDEAKRVADTLSRCRDRDSLIALLADGELGA